MSGDRAGRMHLNRGKDFRAKTGDSPATFYRKRNLPEGHVERIPPPDGHLNNGRTPVWLDETIDSYIARVLEHSRAEHRPAGRVYLSLELLLAQVEAFADSSAQATRELRQAVARGEERRRQREPIREKAGRPRNAGDDLDYMRGLTDAAGLNLMQARGLTKAEALRVLAETSGEHTDTTQRRMDRALAEKARRLGAKKPQK